MRRRSICSGIKRSDRFLCGFRGSPLLPLFPAVLVLAALLFFSCETDSHLGTADGGTAGVRPPQKTEAAAESAESRRAADSWKAVTSLADLEGRWESSVGSLYEYPFRVDGKKYLRIAWREVDDTERWQSWAARQDMDMESLWQMRYACLSDIYRQALPAADANGTQYGIKLSRLSGRILSRREMLVSERLLLVNLGFFRLSPDGNSFVEHGSLRLASDVFSDISRGGTIYRKKTAEKSGGN